MENEDDICICGHKQNLHNGNFNLGVCTVYDTLTGSCYCDAFQKDDTDPSDKETI